MYVFQENLTEISKKSMDCIMYIYKGSLRLNQGVHGIKVINTNIYQEHILLFSLWL